MPRRGLLTTDQVADPTVQRNFERVRGAIERLALDDDMASGPISNLIATGNIPPGVSFVVFGGGASQTLTLPPANALGPSTGLALIFLNTSPNTVTIIPSRGDSVNGTTSMTVATNVLAILACDGVSKWLRNV